MKPGWCLICGTARRREFASKRADRVTRRVGGSADPGLRFVLCETCGHVYQDPMLDEDDLRRVYTDEYRPLLTDEAAIEREMRRGRPVSEQLADWVEPSVRRRTVLDVGCGSGTYLLPFKERGWAVFGIDPVPRWTDFARRRLGGTPETIVTGHYGPGALPGRRFSLIIFSHTVEHLPDPIPLLRAMRGHLEEDGVLFVATPNLLNPPARERLFEGFLAGAHVRLYSPASLTTVLARAGFRITGGVDFPGRFGMGLLARPRAREGETIPPGPYDDPLAIRQFYGALQEPETAAPLGRNLLGLRAGQRWLMPILCQRQDARRYRIETRAGAPRALFGVTARGDEVPIARWDGRAGPDPADAVPWDRLAEDAGIVQLGLGSGDEALALARRLRGAQRLAIWEADPVLAKLVLKAVDLTGLWASGRAMLHVGKQPVVPPGRSFELLRPSLVYRSGAAARWDSPVYDRIEDLIDASAPRVGPAVEPVAPGAVAPAV